MDEKQFAVFEKTLEAACDKHLADGGGFVAGRFYFSEKEMCPLRVVSGPLTSTKESFAQAVSRVLGFTFTENNMVAFYQAFDGKYNQHLGDDERVWKLGERLRKKYNPRYCNVPLNVDPKVPAPVLPVKKETIPIVEVKGEETPAAVVEEVKAEEQPPTEETKVEES